MRSNDMTEDRHHMIHESYANEINPDGRYGILTQGTVPAFSILNGA